MPSYEYIFKNCIRTFLNCILFPSVFMFHSWYFFHLQAPISLFFASRKRLRGSITTFYCISISFLARKEKRLAYDVREVEKKLKRIIRFKHYYRPTPQGIFSAPLPHFFLAIKFKFNVQCNTWAFSSFVFHEMYTLYNNWIVPDWFKVLFPFFCSLDIQYLK